MKRTHAVGAAALAALTALALAACGSDDNSGDTPSSAAPTSGESTAAMETTPAVTLSGTLNGGGSSAQSKAQEAWVAGFQTANSGATVNYTVSDSGAGRKGFLDSSLDFAGSDGALSTDELTSSKDRCYGGSGIDLPNYVSPIAIAFNIPGVTSLNLTPDTIAKIFNGTITTWDDPAITADNSGASLSGPITVVHRSDDSGTTKNFTDTLKQLAPDVWTYDVTNTYPVQVGQGANGTQGVVQTILSATGTIGYADKSGVDPSLGLVSIGVGDTFVAPTADAAAAIVAQSPLDDTRAANDVVVKLDRTLTGDVYPAVLLSYLIVCDTYDTQDKADLVAGYVSYVTGADGQSAAATSAGSAPLASELQAKIATAIESITVKG